MIHSPGVLICSLAFQRLLQMTDEEDVRFWQSDGSFLKRIHYICSIKSKRHMENTVLFTAEERSLFFQLFKRLRNDSPEMFEGDRYRTLKHHLAVIIGQGRFHRGMFNLNPIIRSMQTAILSAEDIGLKNDSLIACLLMPYITTEEELDDIDRLYGKNVKVILHGLIHIRELYKKSPSVESENFRNLLVSFAEDMRVILIMIADRTNLMRSIKDTTNDEAKLKASEEAAYLYAPLAHKLGLYQIKSELEDLSLKYMNHDAYYLIKNKLNATKKSRDEYIRRFIAPISEMLTQAGFKFHIKGRTKSIHSIWQKMKKQNCNFEGVYDLFAIRIILDAPLEKEKLQCWQVYSMVTDMYRPNPKRLRDWLSIPKSNGYESLHITVLGPENKWVEVQIRTERMDEIAEHGLAAHWRYKGIKAEQSGIDSWLANIRTALENNDNLQMMDQFKSELYTDEAYVFTPKGDLHKLPKGATVLDFAYSIHTNIGNKCIGAIVNGKNVSMRYQLASGDQVAVLTSNSQSPKRAWLEFVVTGRAKAKIRQSIKELELKEGAIAREQLERTFRNRKIELEPTLLNQTVKKLGYKELNLFYKDLANDDLDIEKVLEAYDYVYKKETFQLERAEVHSAEEFTNEQEQAWAHDDNVLVIDKNLKGVDYSLAKCCNPIYGDEIFGFVTVDKGIKIHRTNCPNAHALRERFGYRIVKARWAGQGTTDNKYPIVLRIVGNDDLGVVNNISSIISKEEKINMRSFSIDTNDGLFSGSLTLMVGNLTALDSIIKKLKTVKGVKNVTRG